MNSLIGPMDEFPIHQAPLPIARPTSSDRNFYDRSYFNAMSPSNDTVLITGLGFYPNLRVKDAFVLVHRGNEHTALQLSDGFDPVSEDRMSQHVLGYRVEVREPLRQIRLVLEETEGIAFDLTWNGSFDVVQEQRHLLFGGVRPILDAQRFAQLGSWTGELAIDGETLRLDGDWMGSRDRSWGIRPTGEPEPEGRPADAPMEGFWWLYVPMRFEDFSIVIIIQEDPSGFRTLNDATRVWADGRVEQLGWPRIEIDYAPGTRTPTGARLHCTAADGSPVLIEVEPHVGVPLHVGGGYGGDPEWAHGRWMGEGFVRRVAYDLTAPEVMGRIPFGVTDHSAHGRCGDARGFGLFEHASMGRHDPTGFKDWSNDRV